jgi:hypothetical protein
MYEEMHQLLSNRHLSTELLNALERRVPVLHQSKISEFIQQEVQVLWTARGYGRARRSQLVSSLRYYPLRNAYGY